MRTRSELIMCYYQEQLLQMHIIQMQNIYVMLTVDSMRASNLTNEAACFLDIEFITPDKFPTDAGTIS